MNTFSGFCIAACIFIIFVGLATAVVGSLNQSGSSDVFPNTPNIDVTDASSSSTYNVSTYIWVGGSVATLLLAIAVAITSKSTNLIALTVFGGTFWTSWGSMAPVFDTFGFTSNNTGFLIIGMLTLGMTMMFIGAVIGILSPGSTAMR